MERPPLGTTATYDANGGLDNTSQWTLAAGAMIDNQDFGYSGFGSIGDFVWFDADADGVQDPGEPGLPGVTVELDIDVDGNGTIEQTLSTATDSAGAYVFPGLSPGLYTVRVTQPAGTVQTFDNDGTLDNQSQVALTPAQNDDTHDFGYRGIGSIGDLVWVDADADGVQDPGEPGLGGVDVTIKVDLNGTGGPDYTATTTTDPNGLYLFTNLVPGMYTVTVNSATVPLGVVANQTHDADGPLDHSSTATVSVATPDHLNENFGYRGIGSIGNSIFLDYDGNGLPDPGEGLAGVPVNLRGDLNGDGVDEILATVTDGSGGYVFGGLTVDDGSGGGVTYTVLVDTTLLPATVAPTVDPDGTLDNTSTVILTVGSPANQDQDWVPTLTDGDPFGGSAFALPSAYRLNCQRASPGSWFRESKAASHTRVCHHRPGQISMPGQGER